MRTSPDRKFLRRILTALACLLLLSELLQAQDSTVIRMAQVTYLTGNSAYVSAGTGQGIHPGDRLEVMRENAVIGVLEVVYVSTQRASCTIVSHTADLTVGDQVRFHPTPGEAEAVAMADSAAPSDTVRAAVTAPPPSRAKRSAPGLHGRLGVRYLIVRQRSGAAQYSQPAADIRLDGPLGSSGLTLGMDVRARRTNSTLADGSRSDDQAYRVYGLALGWIPAGSPFRFTVGRQFSAPLANVSFFDGVMAEFLRPSWGMGVFAGTQPTPADLGFSTDAREYGGYFQLRNRPGMMTRWSFTTGLVGSYQGGQVNREFVFLSSTFYTKRLSAYLHQEVDYNRGWKTTAGEKTISPTSTYASLSLRAAESVTLRAGFDNRRNVRLYRDFINPETQFDDSFRQGYWGGISIGVARFYHLDVDARNSAGGPAGDAQSYTLSLGANQLFGLDADVRTRSTRYLTSSSQGWLHSLALGWSPLAPLHFEVNGGWRNNFNPLDNPESSRMSWVGLDLDVRAGRRWLFLLSASHESGLTEASDQLFGGFSVNF